MGTATLKYWTLPSARPDVETHNCGLSSQLPHEVSARIPILLRSKLRPGEVKGWNSSRIGTKSPSPLTASGTGGQQLEQGSVL